jgi:hypothetical protein
MTTTRMAKPAPPLGRNPSFGCAQEDRGQTPVSDDPSLESGRGLPRRKGDNVLLLSDAEP